MGSQKDKCGAGEESRGINWRLVPHDQISHQYMVKCQCSNVRMFKWHTGSCHGNHLALRILIHAHLPCPGGSVVTVLDLWPGGCEFSPRTFFLVYFCLSPLQKHVRKVVGGCGKKSCVSTGVRKPGNMCVTDRHHLTLAVKVASEWKDKLMKELFFFF